MMLYEPNFYDSKENPCQGYYTNLSGQGSRLPLFFLQNIYHYNKYGKISEIIGFDYSAKQNTVTLFDYLDDLLVSVHHKDIMLNTHYLINYIYTNNTLSYREDIYFKNYHYYKNNIKIKEEYVSKIGKGTQTIYYEYNSNGKISTISRDICDDGIQDNIPSCKDLYYYENGKLQSIIHTGLQLRYTEYLLWGVDDNLYGIMEDMSSDGTFEEMTTYKFICT